MNRQLRPPRRTINVPLRIRTHAHVSNATRSELENIRQSVALALAQCGTDPHREGFKPGLMAYRDAIDTLLSIRPPGPLTNC